ncbi:MAG TPA: DUF4157 domain-containing protein [Steroidobacteraceae bacterium]|nr:DUF4157 domain-containing protein [Steroidobacteraceae bacterium]
MGRQVAVPPNVQAALESIFGPGVAQVRVIENSLFARLHLRATATTRRRRIYLRGSAAAFFDDPALMLHEYCHVLKQWEPGLLTTARYVLEWLRRGYWDNRFEIEAREFAADHLYRFRALLTRGRFPAARINLAD